MIDPDPPEDDDDDDGPVDDGSPLEGEEGDGRDDGAFNSDPEQINWIGPGEIEQDGDEDPEED